MAEYIIVKAPHGRPGEDYMQIWLNGNDAVGRELVCTYFDGRDLYFVFRLVDSTAAAGVLADEADQQERDTLQVRISENVPDTMTTRPYDYELRDMRLREMSERERRWQQK